MSSELPSFRHVWIGRPVKSRRQPLELAILHEDHVALPKLSMRIWKSGSEPFSAVAIEGTHTDAGYLSFRLNELGEGPHSGAIAIAGDDDWEELPQTICVLSEEDLHAFLAGGDDKQIRPSRLVGAESAKRYAWTVLRESLPFVPDELLSADARGLLPDELAVWATSCVADDLAILDAFGLVELSVTLGSDINSYSHFWETTDSLDVSVRALFREPASETARSFLTDELGFAGRLRSSPEMSLTTRRAEVGERHFLSDITITANVQHFIDFVVSITDKPERIEHLRTMVAKRPGLARLEVSPLSEADQKHLSIKPGEAPAQLRQNVAHQTSYLAQRMTHRHTRLRRHIGKQRALIQEYPAHPIATPSLVVRNGIMSDRLQGRGFSADC